MPRLVDCDKVLRNKNEAREGIDLEKGEQVLNRMIGEIIKSEILEDFEIRGLALEGLGRCGMS